MIFFVGRPSAHVFIRLSVMIHGFCRTRSTEKYSFSTAAASAAGWCVGAIKHFIEMTSFTVIQFSHSAGVLAIMKRSPAFFSLRPVFCCNVLCGGGAIMAPIFVAVFGLPVHAVAGAALMGTFVTSVVGVASVALGGAHSVRPFTETSASRYTMSFQIL